jgi:hypothetical protein
VSRSFEKKEPDEPRTIRQPERASGAGPDFGALDSLPPASDTGLFARIQAKSAEGDAAAADQPAAAPTTTPPGLLADDDAAGTSPIQMRKSPFLAELRASVTGATEEALAGTIYSSLACPYIDRWFDRYADKDARRLELAIRKYAPETRNAITARDYIPIVTARVRRGVVEWSSTGKVTGLPEELQNEVPGAGAGIAAGVLGAAAGSISTYLGGAVSAVGGLLFKNRSGKSGSAAPEQDPAVVKSRLKSGQSLDAGVRSRMEGTFGADFSGVRVHTDSEAAELSDSMDARAFTVGRDIAFGSGEYRPGTPVGDALIAHELAHVAQQGATTAAAPRAKSEGDNSALEAEADESAVSAVLSAWTGLASTARGLGGTAGPRLRSGLRLQRCSGPEPSRMSDQDVEATDVYKKITDPQKPWQKPNPLTHEEALLAARLILRDKKPFLGFVLEGSYGDYVARARHQLQVAGTATGMVGSPALWKPSGPGSGTTFEKWVSASTEGAAVQLLQTTIINCWEVILLAAYQTNLLSWQRIHDLYTYHSDHWNDYLVKWLTSGEDVEFDMTSPNTPRPQRGDIVRFNGAAHVALATGERDAMGRSKVISFWPPPNNPQYYAVFLDVVKETTIEELGQFMIDHGMGPVEIRFASPPW